MSNWQPDLARTMIVQTLQQTRLVSTQRANDQTWMQFRSNDKSIIAYEVLLNLADIAVWDANWLCL